MQGRVRLRMSLCNAMISRHTKVCRADGVRRQAARARALLDTSVRKPPFGGAASTRQRTGVTKYAVRGDVKEVKERKPTSLSPRGGRTDLKERARLSTACQRHHIFKARSWHCGFMPWLVFASALVCQHGLSQVPNQRIVFRGPPMTTLESNACCQHTLKHFGTPHARRLRTCALLERRSKASAASKKDALCILMHPARLTEPVSLGKKRKRS